MGCKPELLRTVPLFALLDDDETAVLASQVELKTFSPRERIYKMAAPGGQAYVMITGKVRVSTVDEDGQDVVVDELSVGEIFGFASMLEQTPHRTNAVSLEETTCLEIDRNDIATLLQRKPHAGMDLLTASKTSGSMLPMSQRLCSQHLRRSRRAAPACRRPAKTGSSMRFRFSPRIWKKGLGFGGSSLRFSPDSAPGRRCV